jgi:uncharacterized Zn finger protein
MPEYTYKCRNCSKTKTEVLPMETREKPCAFPCDACGRFSLYIQIQPTKMSYQGAMRTDGSFNDRLKEIKKTLPEGSDAQNNINEQIR